MIQSLSIQGFKSFADRVRLEFEGGVTAIVGPNGSGKSNVVEALRWACHAARARELRAGRASELIFHGSGGKAPLGLAEVRLDLRPASGPITLARRIYRDGTAEQDLAGRAARARDVQAALRGTGLGPGGLAVIGQGEVSGVVQAEGAALLGYLLEAAGLSAALAARDETGARLTDADGHLGQLALALADLESRLARLGREAAAARQARELTLRELALRDAIARARQEGLLRELEASALRAAELEAQSAALAARTAEGAAEVDALRERLSAAAAERARHAQALTVVQGARERLALATVAEGRQQAEAERLEAERARLNVTPPAEAAPNVAALDAALLEARRARQAAEGRAAQLERTLSQARAQATRSLEQRARLEAAHDAARSEQARLDAALTAAEADIGTVSALHAQARAEREAADAAWTERTRERDALQLALREAGGERAALAAARGPLERERGRLEALLNSHARYGEGARLALQSGHAGLIGAVADLLVVPAAYETAVTAALGRRLEQVVVGRSEDAREIIEHLKRVGGRATFLPLDLLRPRARRDGPLRREAAVLGNLADLCPSDPAPVSEALLADTLLVEDLRAATRLARAHPNRPRLVTLDGELIEPGGALTGGRLRDSGLGHLADSRRLTELDAELADLQRRDAQLRARQDEVTPQVAALEAALVTARAARDAALEAERRAERRLADVQAAQRTHTAALAALQARHPGAAPAPEASTPDLDLAALEAEVAVLREQAREHAARERALLEALGRGRELAAAWQAHAREARRAAEIALRLTTLGAERAEQEVLTEEARVALAAAQAQAGAFDDGAYAQLVAQRDAAAQAHATSIGRLNAVRSELEALRLSAARREAALEELPPGALLPGTPREWPAELNRVLAAREALGAVNALAEQDLQEEGARLDTLRAEHADATAAVAELRGVLADLERDLHTALGGAFSRVAAAFAGYAAELLGGSGDLEADRDVEGRLTGLRLAVQPRGKRTRSMTLLSAGERTMAGLAFLFALNHATEGGGLPLAVLDEVDAPLDEANIRRFTRFLEVFAQRGTQFLLVTHQKATMEAATSLWGVTTDASGASKVLSIRQAAEVGLG